MQDLIHNDIYIYWDHFYSNCVHKNSVNFSALDDRIFCESHIFVWTLPKRKYLVLDERSNEMNSILLMKVNLFILRPTCKTENGHEQDVMH